MRHVFLLALCLLGGAGLPQPAAAAEPARRIGLVRVRGDGPCRLPLARLAALGVEDPYRLEVRRAGLPVPCFTAEEVPLDPAHVVFDARATAGPHAATAVYELWRRPEARAPLPMPHSPGTTLPRTLATDRFHGPLGAADPAVYDPPGAAPPGWFLLVLPPGAQAEVTLGPLGATPGRPQVLEATVYGTWRELGVLEATWGGRDLGAAATPDPSRAHVLTWSVPAGAVPDGPAPLVLRNVSPRPSPPPARDVSDHRGTLYVDRLTLLGDGRRPVPWRDSRVLPIEPAGAPAEPLRAVGGAEHVILATPPLLVGARRLAAHRTARGLPSAAVSVLDVYDRHGHGARTPQAILEFVLALRRRGRAPLRYLLLAGDATYDRTDIADAVTIPAPMARTMYNGATPADGLYAPEGDVAVGRLPFATAAAMDAYVERVVRYETRPPAVAERRLLRFITSPGRFGAFIDGILESRFRSVLSRSVPPLFDVAVTYANPSSPYMWPAASFRDHVVESLNDGALFFTYVGHGFEHGFDTVHAGGRTFPILHVGDAARVDARRMPPVVVVLACTTAMFDGLRGPGIGEALMRRPHGPVAYVGATRICHPGYNALIGESIAEHMVRDDATHRLGGILAAARRDALDPSNRKVVRAAIAALGGAPSARIAREGAQMYVLLGDPALEVAVPRPPLAVQVAPDDAGLAVTVTGPFAAGATVRVTLERSRAHRPTARHADADPTDPMDADRVRANHAAANDLVLAAVEATAAEAGRVAVRLVHDPAQPRTGLVVKALAIGEGRMHAGAAVLGE